MRCVAICSALLLISAATADAQSRLKRDDTPAAAPAPAQKNAKPVRPSRNQQATPAETRPRIKRDDMPAAVATPAAPGKGRTARAPQGAPGGQADAPPKGAKASARDIAACAQTAQLDAAIEGCTRVIEDPKHKPKGRAAAYFNRGNAYSAKGENERAIADYDEAIRLDPKNASAYNNRGSAKSDKGENEAALADFDAAIKQNARYASAYFNRASAYAAQGDARAMQDFDTAIRYNRRNTNAYIARGALLLASGATARARADMRQAAVVDRKNAYAALWHEIAERRARQKSVLGGKGLKDVEMNGWPAPVLLMFVGETRPEDLLIAADDVNAARKQAQTCEANFYGGQYALIGGKRDEAVKLFHTATKDCPRGFLEGIAAAAELKGMGEKVEAN